MRKEQQREQLKEKLALPQDVAAALARNFEKVRHPAQLAPGYRMPVSEVPDIFRDYPVRPLAERIAGDGMLDAADIGAAANSVKLDPEAWNGWASPDDILTQFRRLWYVLVVAGSPRST